MWQTTIFNLEMYWAGSCNSCVAYVTLKTALYNLAVYPPELLQLMGGFCGAQTVPPQRHGRMADGAKQDPVARVAAVATT